MAYIGKDPASGIRNRFIFTATAGQTTFSGADDESRTLNYTDAHFLDVFLNGVKLDKSDYTATSGTSIVLDEGAAVDDTLEVLAFDTFSVFSGEFSQDVTVGGATTLTGDLTVDTNTLYVDSTNNRVGIGTSSPDSHLTVNGSSKVYSTNTGNSITHSVTSTSTYAQTITLDDIGLSFDNNSNIRGYRFSNNGTERMRIDSAGNVYQNVGGTGERGYRVEAGSDDWTYIWGRNNADTSPVFYAQVGNVARAEIESDGSFHSIANSYGGFSDQNYKENIELSGAQWDDIKAVQVKKYSWIHDGLDAPNQLGVIAQDLEASGMGGLVTNLTKLVQQDDGTETAALDDDGNPITYKSVKYSVLYMKAIKALQEAMAKIETLETKVATLETENADFETRLTALEANNV